MIDIDKAWEDFSKKDTPSNFTKSSPELEALQAQMVALTADIGGIKQQLTQLAAAPQGMPPAMPPAMPPMGGGMPPADGAMPPEGGEAPAGEAPIPTDDASGPVEESGPGLGLGESTSEENPPETETDQSLGDQNMAQNIPGATPPADGGSGAPGGLTEDDINMLFGGDAGAGAPEGGAPTGEAPAADLGEGGDAGAPMGDLGAPADLGGGMMGMEEDTVTDDVNSVLDGAREVKDKSFKAEILRVAADHLDSGGSATEGTDELGLLPGTEGGADDLAPLPEEAPLDAPLADAPLEEENIDPLAGVLVPGEGEGEPVEGASVSAPPENAMVDELPDTPEGSADEGTEEKAPAEEEEKEDEPKKEDDKPVKKSCETEEFEKAPVGEVPAEGGLSAGEQNMAENGGDAIAESEPECPCEDKIEDKVKKILGETLGEIAEAVKGSEDYDAESEDNKIVTDDSEEISIVECGDRKPIKKSIDELMAIHAANMRGNDGKFYGFKKSAEQIRLEKIDETEKALNSRSHVTGSEVGAALNELRFLKSQGVANVEKDHADVIDLMVRRLDAEIGPKGTNSFMRSVGIDVTSIYADDESSEVDEPVAKSENAGGKHIMTLNETLTAGTSIAKSTISAAYDSPAAAASGSTVVPDNVEDLLRQKLTIDEMIAERQKR